MDNLIQYLISSLSLGGLYALLFHLLPGWSQLHTPFRWIFPLSLFVAMNIWARVHGIVSLEIQGNLPPFGENGDALYPFELNSQARQFIKE